MPIRSKIQRRQRGGTRPYRGSYRNGQFRSYRPYTNHRQRRIFKRTPFQSRSRRLRNQENRMGYRGRFYRPLNSIQPRRIRPLRRIPRIESKTSLHVTNLHPSVNNAELKSIFETVGELKRCGVHFNQTGNSKGTADVEFVKAEDAGKAIKSLDNTEIEGSIMKVKYGLRKKKMFRKRFGRRRLRQQGDVQIK